MTLLRHGRPKPPCLPILGLKPRTLWRRASLGPWLPIWLLLLSLFGGWLTTAAQAPAVTAQVPAAAASSSGWAAPGVSTAELPWDPIGPGTYHAAFTLRKADAVQPVHVVRVEQGHPYVRLEGALAQGTAGGVGTVLSQALARHAPGSAVVAAINADFFYSAPIAGLPVGLHMQGGEIVTSPSGTPAFGVRRDGRPVIGVPEMQARVWLDEASTGNRLSTDALFAVPSEWRIDLINRPLAGLALALYTPRLGPTTPALEGTAVIVKGITPPLRPGTVYTGTVAARQWGSRAAPLTLEIPRDGVVLAARGPAEEFLELLPLGATIHLEVNLSPPFDQVTDAVSGRPVLVAGGAPAPLNTRDSLVTQRHPRTAIGFNGREVFLVTVDGRRDGHADGMTLFELQELMLALGATEALNLDGGGSTTMVIRPPGTTEPQVVNVPSDGHERAVGNGLLVVSTAPPGQLARLILRPAAPVAYVGSLMPITLLGQDEHHNPRTVLSSQVAWTAAGDAGRVGASGAFSARQPGTAVIEAAVGPIRASTTVTVVDTVAAVTVTPETFSLARGESIALQAQAFDADGRPVWVNPWQFAWSAEGGAVRVDAGGVVTAVRQGEAAVTVRLGGAAATARITVDQPPHVLWGFEEMGGWYANAVRARASLALSGPGEPVREGQRSAKLTYDLRAGGGGTAAAYVQAPAPIPIPGRPRAIGLWVYGDATGHWLRANYIDGEGNRRVTDFTPVGGLTWTGWRWVEAPIDPEAPLPISFERVYVVEFDSRRQSAGVLYFDQLTALYGSAPGQ
ncbi:MAG: hypothetical protein DIU82_08840 [Bacillota bacterium]|nr:MAG: hypothetical protein DIU82_08840 [Bacillota bacterium]